MRFLGFPRFTVLSTKHPGFSEEKEWLVIYNPPSLSSEAIEQHVECVNGHLQRINAIPLEALGDEGELDLSITNILRHVIVGPSELPYTIVHAVLDTFSEAGFENPVRIVSISDIPLRN